MRVLFPIHSWQLRFSLSLPRKSNLSSALRQIGDLKQRVHELQAEKAELQGRSKRQQCRNQLRKISKGLMEWRPGKEDYPVIFIRAAELWPAGAELRMQSPFFTYGSLLIRCLGWEEQCCSKENVHDYGWTWSAWSRATISSYRSFITHIQHFS